MAKACQQFVSKISPVYLVESFLFTVILPSTLAPTVPPKHNVALAQLHAAK